MIPWTTSRETLKRPASRPSSSLSSVERKACLATPVGTAWLLSRGRYVVARHLLLLNLYLVALAMRRIERLLILMPPRHGKSETTSLWFSTWYLHRFPRHMIRLASYGAEYASELGGKVRDRVREHGRALGLQIRKDASDNWTLTTGGGMTTAGMGGPLTGRGADLFLIDDPIKNDKEARSQGIRDDHWEWLTSTAISRLEPGGVMGVIMTHWHHDDIAGRLLAGKMGGEPWTILRLPAIADADEPTWPVGLGRARGEPLWPERFGRRALALRRASMSTYWWSALYQQQPQQDEGTIFKRAWFRYFQVRSAAAGDVYRLFAVDGTWRDVPAWVGFRFATVDVAASQQTTADYFVTAIWHAIPNPTSVLYPYDLLLIHVYRDRLEGPDQQAALLTLWREFGLQRVHIESSGYQLSLVQTAMRDGLPAEPLSAHKDKIARAMDASPMVKFGQVYHRHGAPWLAQWEDELVKFPTGAHDDQVDTLAYAVKVVTAMGGPVGDLLDAGDADVTIPSRF